LPGPPILDPLHYLPTLGHKPGALDHAPVYRDWKLPACFTAFRTELEQHYGATAGTRRFIQVLQILVDHPLDRVRRAVENCRRQQLISADAVIQQTRTLAVSESQTRRSSSWTTEVTTTLQVNVPLPDLSRFDDLLDRPANSEDAFPVAADQTLRESPITVFVT
jgi:hypothetical protein